MTSCFAAHRRGQAGEPTGLPPPAAVLRHHRRRRGGVRRGVQPALALAHAARPAATRPCRLEAIRSRRRVRGNRRFTLRR